MDFGVRKICLALIVLRKFFRSTYTHNTYLEKSRNTLKRILMYEKFVFRVSFFVSRIRLTKIWKNSEIP